MFNNPRYRRKNTTFDATGPLPGVEEQFKERAPVSVKTAREAILQVSLYGAAGFGVVAFLATLSPRIQNGQYLLIGIFAAALTFVTFITFNRRISYIVRAYTFLGLMALLFLSTTFSDGLAGNGRVFLLAIPIMAALLLGPRAGTVSMVLTLALLTVIGVLMSLGVIEPPPVRGNPNSQLSIWFLAVATLLLVAATTTLSLITMMRYLQRSIETEQRLRVELDGERSALEGRIQDRTADLQRRLVQLRTAGEITNVLSAVLDPQVLLQQVVDLVQQRFDLYYVGVFLLDEREEDAILRAGSGEAGQTMLADGHHLRLDGASMIAWSINNRKARIALDVGSDAVRFSNPNLPLTRSELALPLVSGEGGRPIGALTVQSARPQAFDSDDIIVLQSIANALTTALINANLFQQVERSLNEISILNRQYLEQAWTRTGEAAALSGRELRATAENTSLVSALQAARTAADSAPDAQQPPAAVPTTLAVPLAVRDHRFGSIHLDVLPTRPDQAGLSPEEMAFVQDIALEAAQALENVRLLEETQARARREQAINDFIGGLSTSFDLDTLLQSAARRLGSLPNVREAAVRLRLVEPARPRGVTGPLRPSDLPEEPHV